MITETIIIVLIFVILAVVGVILWKASEPAVYDPDTLVAKGEFDPHHHHYTQHHHASAAEAGDKTSHGRTREAALSASARLAEPTWLTPPETSSAVEKPLQRAERREHTDQRQERRAWDRRINQKPTSNDRRNNDRRMAPAHA